METLPLASLLHSGKISPNPSLQRNYRRGVGIQVFVIITSNLFLIRKVQLMICRATHPLRNWDFLVSSAHLCNISLVFPFFTDNLCLTFFPKTKFHLTPLKQRNWLQDQYQWQFVVFCRDCSFLQLFPALYFQQSLNVFFLVSLQPVLFSHSHPL